MRDALGRGPGRGVGACRPPICRRRSNDAAQEGARVFEIFDDGAELWMHTSRRMTAQAASFNEIPVRGRIHYVRIDPRPLERADDWLRGYERLWDTRIERLVAMLRHPDNDPSDSE